MNVVDQVLELKRQGKGVREIAREIGVSPATVSRITRKYPVVMEKETTVSDKVPVKNVNVAVNEIQSKITTVPETKKIEKEESVQEVKEKNDSTWLLIILAIAVGLIVGGYIIYKRFFKRDKQ
ncbi:MAG: helix-turn-helix domain-containing protein [Nitrososphaeria archaeon]